MHPWLKELSEVRELENTEILSSRLDLVTQKNECLGSAVPSKTYGVMAAGRPILFIGPKESTPALVIEEHGCGWQVDCGDTHGLVQLLHCLGQDPQLHIAAGARAHRAFLTHYQRSAGVGRIAEVLGLKQQVVKPAAVRIQKVARAAAG